MVTLVLPLTLSAKHWVIHSGVLTFTCDRPDTALMLSANEELRHLDLVFGSQTNLRVQDSIVTHFYFSKKLAAGTLPDAPYWSGGIARSGREIHIFDQDRTHWRKTLKHELAHIILVQNNKRLPLWFNEGLAQVFADEWTWNKFTILGEANMRDKLIPLSQIDHLFSYNRQSAQLAYAQSQHAFRFMLERYGDGVLPALLQPTELPFSEFYEQITGESLADFETAWREHLKTTFWFFSFTRWPGYLWPLMPLVLILGFILKWRQNRKRMQEWEVEESEGNGSQAQA